VIITHRQIRLAALLKYMCLGVACSCSIMIFPGCFEEEMKIGNQNSQGNEIALSVDETEATSLEIKRYPKEASIFSIITESNLFNQDRKFIPSDDDSNDNSKDDLPKKQMKADLPNLKLVGTMILQKGKSFAFIIDKKSTKLKNKITKFKMGDWIGDYRIIEIGEDKVVFSKGEEVAMLKLKPAEGKAAARGRGKPGSQVNRKRASNRDQANRKNPKKRDKDNVNKTRDRANRAKRNKNPRSADSGNMASRDNKSQKGTSARAPAYKKTQPRKETGNSPCGGRAQPVDGNRNKNKVTSGACGK